MEVSPESRATSFIRLVNRVIADPECTLPYNNPEAALAAASLVADTYWNDESGEANVDDAFVTAAHLAGKSLRAIAIDRRMSHILDRESYGATLRDAAIKRCASAAADLIQALHTGESVEPSEQGASPRKRVRSDSFIAPLDSESTIIYDDTQNKRIQDSVLALTELPSDTKLGIMLLLSAVHITSMDTDTEASQRRATAQERAKRAIRARMANKRAEGIDRELLDKLVSSSEQGLRDAAIYYSSAVREVGETADGAMYRTRRRLAAAVLLLFGYDAYIA